MPFVIATYNVLAPSYVRREWCRFTPAELLEPSQRMAALGDHLLRLDCDLWCLQEVELTCFTALEARLAAGGHAGEYCGKGLGKPDGCAAFWRTDRLSLVRSTRLEFADQAGEQRASGHVAQLLELSFEGKTLGVVNTHVKWDPPRTPPEQQYGLRQIRQILEARAEVGPDCLGWLICGDLNVTPASDVVRELLAAGFSSSDPLERGAATCNSNQKAKQLDYIFHDGAIPASPLPVPTVEDRTPLPSDGQPSDHVAVLGRCAWADSG